MSTFHNESTRRRETPGIHHIRDERFGAGAMGPRAGVLLHGGRGPPPRIPVPDEPGPGGDRPAGALRQRRGAAGRPRGQDEADAAPRGKELPAAGSGRVRVRARRPGGGGGGGRGGGVEAAEAPKNAIDYVNADLQTGDFRQGQKEFLTANLTDCRERLFDFLSYMPKDKLEGARERVEEGERPRMMTRAAAGGGDSRVRYATRRS